MSEIDKLLEKWHTLAPEEEGSFVKDSIEAFNSKTDSEKEKFLNDFQEEAKKACDEAEELIEVITMRDQLDPILPYISLSTIASEYFGKSRNWLYQRINGNLVNGKPAKFTADEKRLFRNAINDIINKLQGVKASLG
ncbi:DUF5053 domain-containing protein [Massilibacteroides sp.]|uniref:DUF5053 domain-containing protein n=1 Tax=Massilibacteroides sp. TaxID=2034766 RepID=UPI00261DE999|nr:DUF5053 domain-containing protein [Massilibacteroides sp.]MDD4515172.1 DUF5053 domain-containing protein [Massilibacteroides sp.]